eukprot:SAG25_NODE_10545_length_330_cov_0.662338_1_plen_105_part_01
MRRHLRLCVRGALSTIMSLRQIFLCECRTNSSDGVFNVQAKRLKQQAKIKKLQAKLMTGEDIKQETSGSRSTFPRPHSEPAIPRADGFLEGNARGTMLVAGNGST